MIKYKVVREYRNSNGVLTGCNSIGFDRKLYTNKEDAQNFCEKLNEHNTRKGESFVVVDVP